MKIKEAVKLYNILGEAKVTCLEDSEIIKIIKTRKILREIVESYEQFLNDVRNKFKPDDFDIIQNKIHKWNILSDDEKIAINVYLKKYEDKIKDVMKDESEKELNLTIEKLAKESVVKLIKQNNWSINKLDEMSPMLWQETN